MENQFIEIRTTQATKQQAGACGRTRNNPFQNKFHPASYAGTARGKVCQPRIKEGQTTWKSPAASRARDMGKSHS
jgi:hypothetical protein